MARRPHRVRSRKDRRFATAPAIAAVAYGTLLSLITVTPKTASAGPAYDPLGTPRHQRLYKSAYFLGRGDTGISEADNEEAIFYNPAGLALGKGIFKEMVLASPMVEYSTATKSLVRQIAVEDANTIEALRSQVGAPQHVGLNSFTGIVLRRVALGGFVSSNTDILVAQSPNDGGLEHFEASTSENAGAVFSLAEAFFNRRLLIGMTSKYIYSMQGEVAASVADSERVREIKQEDLVGIGQGVGTDVGLMWKGGGKSSPALGVTVENVGDTRLKGQQRSEIVHDFKQTINVGVSVQPGTRTSRFRLLADYRDVLGAIEKNPYKRIHLGAELSVLDAIGFTTGMNDGYPCGGMFLDLRFLRLDAGMYVEEYDDRAGVRPDLRNYVRVKVGF